MMSALSRGKPQAVCSIHPLAAWVRITEVVTMGGGVTNVRYMLCGAQGNTPTLLVHIKGGMHRRE